MKKGQVTAWIIIGLIIVIVAGLLFAYWDNISRSYVEYKNPSAKSVRLFVEECVEETSKEAVKFASLQGGYVDVPAEIIYSSPVQPAFLPPPYPDGSLPPFQTPLWWYKGRDRTPTLSSIELNIAKYVEKNVNNCLRDFRQFEGVFAESDVDVDVSLSQSVLSVEYNQPLKIEGDERVDSISKFSVGVPTKLRKLFTLAKDIHDLENKDAFLEDVTVDLLANAHDKGGISIPFEGYEFDCGKKIWSVQFDIIPALQSLVKYNMKYLSFENTIPNYDEDHKINREIDVEVCLELDDSGLCTRTRTEKGKLFDYYKENYRFKPTSKNYNDVRVRVSYDKTYFMDVNVEPSKGDLVKPSTMDIPIIGSCMNVYAYKYDIEYPLMFTLESEDGEIFNFATSVKVQRNEARRYYSPYIQHEFYEDGLLKEGEYYYNPSSEDYCSNTEFEKDVIIKDRVTNRNINGASVRYECVGFSCDLGETKRPEFDGIPIAGTVPFLKAKFPRCTNGFVSASAENYRENAVQVSINSGSSLPVLELTPMKKLNVTAFKIQKVGSSISIKQLEENEQVFISIYSEAEDYDDIAYYPPIEYDPSLDLIFDNVNYLFDAKLIKDGKLTGGLYLENWKVNRNDLENVNEIRVYVLESISEIEDLDQYKKFWQGTVIGQSPNHLPILR